jgi:hypothetical protein
MAQTTAVAVERLTSMAATELARFLDCNKTTGTSAPHSNTAWMIAEPELPAAKKFGDGPVPDVAQALQTADPSLR